MVEVGWGRLLDLGLDLRKEEQHVNHQGCQEEMVMMERESLHAERLKGRYYQLVNQKVVLVRNIYHGSVESPCPRST